MERFAGLEAFVAVVEEGSFTAAANALGVSKSHISKQVSALENRLGARLLNRTTRSLALTSAGHSFHERCVRILEDVDEAERAVMQLHTEPRGLLRMSVPHAFGLAYIAPAVADFLCEHPDLEIDLDFSDRRVDLIAEGLDLVIRIGELADSSFAFKKLAPIDVMLCVSPAYVERFGKPTTPDDIDPAHLFQYAYAPSTALRFEKDGQERVVRASGRLRSNNGEALTEAAIHGVGIALAPDFLVMEHVRRGRLIPILQDWLPPDRRALWALYPHSRHLSAKVRAFVDFLAERLSPPPWVS